MKEKNTDFFSVALGALRRGEAIVFPTETFYGLGADALDSNAVERVVSLKGRNPDSPIAVIIADQEMLSQIVDEVSPPARKLIDRFWPGPMTLILRAKRGLPSPLLNREGKIGVRVSSHPVAARLSRELGHPLTATSANLSGQEPARTAQQGRAYFGDRIEIYLDGGTLKGGSGSTVAEVVGNRLKIIREGEISSQELEKAIRS
ncbi:MAG: L-threonylcarbamoyladenylate synthase [Candidatus Binatia bacterium]